MMIDQGLWRAMKQVGMTVSTKLGSARARLCTVGGNGLIGPGCSVAGDVLL
ncbi:hypothetical protein D8674_011786 [Pyrus ussuriensis x Pyrus communis]|uniref:Uncharacterized protein n=1 Tax=Pyrus ussuriensis x Pyrus communis TaxID=2448454 RepID=A0A5N5FZQ4_9ROSA|nr:hypothetical protein D8674_011786 [Pyrus ussuriensis x Pyrus communis]